MAEQALTELTDQQLLEKKSKVRTQRVMLAVLIGVMVGVAAYSVARKGLSAMAFVPLLCIPLVRNQQREHAQLDAELKARNLV